MTSRDLAHRGSPKPHPESPIFSLKRSSEAAPSTSGCAGVLTSSSKRRKLRSPPKQRRRSKKQHHPTTVQDSTSNSDDNTSNPEDYTFHPEHFPRLEQWVKTASTTENAFEEADSESVSGSAKDFLTMPSIKGLGSIRTQTSKTHESISGDSLYRWNILKPQGIHLMNCPNWWSETNDKSLIPPWVQTIVERIVDQNSPVHDPTNSTTNPSEALLLLNCSKLYNSLHKEQILQNEEMVKTQLGRYLDPLSADQVGLETWEARCQPFTITTSLGAVRPVPDIIFGYPSYSFTNDIDMRTDELIATYCNEAMIMFPYLIVEFKQMGGNLWHAANQCMGGSAISLYQTEKMVGYGEVIFSVAMTDEVADIYIMWSSPDPIDESNFGRF
ncbi:uncharacterized protein GGS22DRAFT_192863 [Annulohypoxylon maeteangense]|uniref:uncharacterized protein n=1 Tax=Annulohypoxylon maeteangense TaxID=1927788 RepID=UPI00200878E1|nr:uncharacterized protein GGS22DRAFT_192863 [Annulohypoxylon maeteangense]KAI0880728.1 hypothetical protein GGS22DRAFT_192863 [Annulohypoxylon maeteangense]